MKAKRVFLLAIAVAGVALVGAWLIKLVAARGIAEPSEVRLSDGRLFCVEAVTFGAGHIHIQPRKAYESARGGYGLGLGGIRLRLVLPDPSA